MKALSLNNPNSANGKRGTPFFRFLTDDGTDYTLAENYSGAATDLYWTAPMDALIYHIDIIVADDDFSQGAAFLSKFGTATLTNGLLIAVLSGSTLIHDFTVSQPVTDFVALDVLSANGSVQGSKTTVNTNRNFLVADKHISCIDKFGAPISIKSGQKFTVRVQDDFSSLSSFRMAISGRYV